MGRRTRSVRLLAFLYVVVLVGAFLPSGVRHLLGHAVRGELEPHAHLTVHTHPGGRPHAHLSSAPDALHAVSPGVGWGLEPIAGVDPAAHEGGHPGIDAVDVGDMHPAPPGGSPGPVVAPDPILETSPPLIVRLPSIPRDGPVPDPDASPDAPPPRWS